MPPVSTDYGLRTVSPAPTMISVSDALDNLEGRIRADDGWIPITGTFTRASATTITVSSNATLKYSVGDKIKLTDTTTKYFYVTAVTSTTLTVTGGGDYSLVGTISNGFYSKAVTPLGMPSWFSYTPIYGAGGSMTFTSVTTRIGEFTMLGKLMLLRVSAIGTTGGSASTTLTFSLPVSAASLSVGEQNSPVTWVEDGGGTWGMVGIGSNASTASVYRNGITNYGLGGSRGFYVQMMVKVA